MFTSLLLYIYCSIKCSINCSINCSIKTGPSKILLFSIKNKKCLAEAKHLIYYGDPGGIRTPDPRLRRPLLYPTELRARCIKKPGDFPMNLVGDKGFEPLTLWSQTRCATGLRYSPTFFVKSNALIRLFIKTQVLAKI